MLQALDANDLVSTETEYIGKRIREYYKLSVSNKNKTKEKLSELMDFMATVKFLIDLKTKTA